MPHSTLVLFEKSLTKSSADTRSHRHHLTLIKSSLNPKATRPVLLPVMYLVSASGTSLRLSHGVIPNQAMIYSYVLSHLVYGGMPLARSYYNCLQGRYLVFKLISTISSSHYYMTAAATTQLSLLYTFHSADISNASEL